MKFVFSLISNFPKGYRAPLVSKFIEFNNSFDYFEQLSLESDHSGLTGSAVPMLQGRVEYLQTLIPLFDTVSLLKHKQHVERIIKSIRAEIDREKKKDFMDD